MSNSFLADHALVALADFIDAGLADAATYTPAGGGAAVPCQVMVDRAVQPFGMDSRVAGNSIVLTALVAEVGTPARGATFHVGAETFSVDAPPIAADEAVVVMPVVVAP